MAGNSSAISTLMMAMTTSSSIRVKPGRVRVRRLMRRLPQTWSDSNDCSRYKTVISIFIQVLAVGPVRQAAENDHDLDDGESPAIASVWSHGVAPARPGPRATTDCLLDRTRRSVSLG